MTRTPTPEDPSFKEWLHKTYKSNVQEFNPNFLPHLEDLCEAYAHHKMMKVDGELISQLTTYQQWRRGEDESIPQPEPKFLGEVIDNTIIELRKVAALQELVESSMKEVHKHTRLTLEFKDKVVELQQQLTEANAEIERLKGELSQVVTIYLNRPSSSERGLCRICGGTDCDSDSHK